MRLTTWRRKLRSNYVVTDDYKKELNGESWNRFSFLIFSATVLLERKKMESPQVSIDAIAILRMFPEKTFKIFIKRPYFNLLVF